VGGTRGHDHGAVVLGEPSYVRRRPGFDGVGERECRLGRASPFHGRRVDGAPTLDPSCGDHPQGTEHGHEDSKHASINPRGLDTAGRFIKGDMKTPYRCARAEAELIVGPTYSAEHRGPGRRRLVAVRLARAAARAT
jgi:hypothetical protein